MKFFILLFFYGIFFFYFYVVPLIYAIKRGDYQAVRLLLQFGANANVIVKHQKKDDPSTVIEQSALAIAARFGHYQIIKMLLNSQAHISDGNQNPLLVSLKSGRSCRECLAALIQGQEDELLKPISNHSLLYYALQDNSTLLPLIASISKIQYEKHVKKNDLGDLYAFPPSDIEKNSDKKKITEALKYNDIYLPYKSINDEVDQIISPWEHTENPSKTEGVEFLSSFTYNSEDESHLYYSSSRQSKSMIKGEAIEEIDMDASNPIHLSQQQLGESIKNKEKIVKKLAALFPEQNSDNKKANSKRRISFEPEVEITFSEDHENVSDYSDYSEYSYQEIED